MVARSPPRESEKGAKRDRAGIERSRWRYLVSKPTHRQKLEALANHAELQAIIPKIREARKFGGSEDERTALGEELRAICAAHNLPVENVRVALIELYNSELDSSKLGR